MALEPSCCLQHLLCVSSCHLFPQAIDGSRDPQYEIPVNQGPITIDSSFFEGVMEIHLRGLSNTKQEVFEGKKRFFQIMCQVQTETGSAAAKSSRPTVSHAAAARQLASMA
eukprot:GHUV01042710.1.p1 GENE.GHUV01042710.1~~GHUV01042710.1.p1  ORF type:complete len:111 (-),score=22.30 GHUV01042710.1:30-362(-)